MQSILTTIILPAIVYNHIIGANCWHYYISIIKDNFWDANCFSPSFPEATVSTIIKNFSQY